MTASYSTERGKSATPHLHPNAKPPKYEAEFDGRPSVNRDQIRKEQPDDLLIILEAACLKLVRPDALRATEELNGSSVEFAYQYESDFACTLDMRHIAWQYKPRTFAVDWDDDGNFVDCFTPAFYLSESETYITLIAPLSSEASQAVRNVKLLRRHYPEIRIETIDCGYRHH